jgi:hypothetical protein
MEKRKTFDRITAVFQEESCFKLFLLSVLITGVSYGIYKGMLDNFLAEVVMLGEKDALPAMNGVSVPAGRIEVAPGSCTFIVL